MSMLWLEANKQVSKGQTQVLSKSYGKGGSFSKTPYWTYLALILVLYYLYLVMLALHSLQKSIAYSLKYTGYSTLKALTFKDTAFSHSHRDRSYTTENNTCHRGL